jgi:hypothetical protein
VAVANFLKQINLSIAFTIHTYGDKFLSSWDYIATLATYKLYAEFASEFIPVFILNNHQSNETRNITTFDICLKLRSGLNSIPINTLEI